MTYSIKKGLIKGFISIGTIVVAGLAFTQFADMSIWTIIETYAKPLLGSLTIGGAITMMINYLKVKSST